MLAEIGFGLSQCECSKAYKFKVSFFFLIEQNLIKLAKEMGG